MGNQETGNKKRNGGNEEIVIQSTITVIQQSDK